jgi:hypothetical protein
MLYEEVKKRWDEEFLRIGEEEEDFNKQVNIATERTAAVVQRIVSQLADSKRLRSNE